MGRPHGSLNLPHATGESRDVSACLRDAGGAVGAPHLPPVRLQAGRDEAPRGSPCAPLSGCPQVRRCCLHLGRVLLAAGKVRNVILLLLDFFSFFPPKISSLPEARGQGGDTSVRLVQRPFASELLSQQRSAKGSLCPGWDKGTSLIKLV